MLASCWWQTTKKDSKRGGVSGVAVFVPAAAPFVIPLLVQCCSWQTFGDAEWPQ